MSRFLTLAALAVALALPASHAQSLPEWGSPLEPAPSIEGPTAHAAPPGTPGGGTNPPQVPIDGGLGLLALAGAAYAGRKLHRARS